jgi:hypothetical protein
VEALVEELVAPGGTSVRVTEEKDGYFVAMRDPEDNELDVH